MTDSAFRDGRERCLEAVMRSWEDALLPSCPKEQMLKETVATMGRGAEDSQLPSEGEREFREASTFHGSLRRHHLLEGSLGDCQKSLNEMPFDLSLLRICSTYQQNQSKLQVLQQKLQLRQTFAGTSPWDRTRFGTPECRLQQSALQYPKILR